MNFLITIEARMTSSRLPGKVLMKALDKPLLELMVERVKKSKYAELILIATTTNSTDDSIESLANSLGILCYRGSEQNVLERIYYASKTNSAEFIIELTGDCPLIDPKLIDDCVDEFIKSYPKSKYVTNSNNSSVPCGMDVQAFSFSDLEQIYLNKPDENDKEHVSYSFYAKKDSSKKFNPTFLRYSPPLHRPELRVTLDYLEDYVTIKKIFEDLYPRDQNFGLKEIINWLDSNPIYRDLCIEVRKKN